MSEQWQRFAWVNSKAAIVLRNPQTDGLRGKVVLDVESERKDIRVRHLGEENVGPTCCGTVS